MISLFFDILNSIMLPNRDNGVLFTNTERIDKINTLLWNTEYRRCNVDGLFFLYSVKPIEDIKDPVLISSHIDCVREITRFFVKDCGDDFVSGTFDNCITNAAVLYLMMNGYLKDNVIVAFTGDEEENSNGAKQLANYLKKKNKKPKHTIVLDVTDMGWNEGLSFTIENNFWSDDESGMKIIDIAKRLSDSWIFVPSDVDDIPEYIPSEFVIEEEAEEDESWEYDERDLECFSLCLPTQGSMHSNLGVTARKKGIAEYINALKTIVNNIAEHI